MDSTCTYPNATVTVGSGVLFISVVCVGAGGNGYETFGTGIYAFGGGGGTLSYRNGIAVASGDSLLIVAGTSASTGTSCTTSTPDSRTCRSNNNAANSSKEHNRNKNAALHGDVLINTTVDKVESYSTHLSARERTSWGEDALQMNDAASDAVWASIRAQYDDVPWNDATDSLAVKNGTKVMFTRNISVADGLVNGATGVVVGQGKRSLDTAYLPLSIRLDTSGREFAIQPVTETAEFVRRSPTGPWAMVREDAEEDGARRLDGTVVVRLKWTFWPLVYGWALSYNKVQGKTLDAGVVLAISPGLLHNMFYTGLTRSPRLSRVWVAPDTTAGQHQFVERGEKLLQRAIKVDARFLRFDAAIREQMRQQGAAFDHAFAQLVAETGRDGSDGERVPTEPPSPACIVCTTERANMVVVPCGHVTMCAGCDARASRLGITACASCRGRAEHRIKLFYAN